MPDRPGWGTEPRRRSAGASAEKRRRTAELWPESPVIRNVYAVQWPRVRAATIHRINAILRYRRGSADSPQIEHRGTTERSRRAGVVSRQRRDTGNNMPESFNKVPEVTLVFWIIKIAATTLGETGGDTVTMTLNWGYLAGTALFLPPGAAGQPADRRRRNFSRFSIGRPSSPPRPLAPPWRISPTARWASAMPAARAAAGTAAVDPRPWYRSFGSISVDTVTRRRSRCSIGPPSPSRRPWARRSATGWPIHRPRI